MEDFHLDEFELPPEDPDPQNSINRLLEAVSLLSSDRATQTISTISDTDLQKSPHSAPPTLIIEPIAHSYLDHPQAYSLRYVPTQGYQEAKVFKSKDHPPLPSQEENTIIHNMQYYPYPQVPAYPPSPKMQQPITMRGPQYMAVPPIPPIQTPLNYPQVAQSISKEKGEHVESCKTSKTTEKNPVGNSSKPDEDPPKGSEVEITDVYNQLCSLLSQVSSALNKQKEDTLREPLPRKFPGKELTSSILRRSALYHIFNLYEKNLTDGGFRDQSKSDEERWKIFEERGTKPFLRSKLGFQTNQEDRIRENVVVDKLRDFGRYIMARLDQLQNQIPIQSFANLEHEINKLYNFTQ